MVMTITLYRYNEMRECEDIQDIWTRSAWKQITIFKTSFQTNTSYPVSHSLDS
jgi:hypothetical protein